MTQVILLSLEPWDDVWRRNQHLASRLVRHGWAASLTFVAPPSGGLALSAVRTTPVDAITVVTPPLLVPRRFGGHAVLGRWIARESREADVLWVNDPVAGAHLIGTNRPMVYDVTDDWRSMPQSDADRDRIVRAEDALARAATTVVCSNVLAERWRQRYGVEATVIPNAVDVDAIRTAKARPLTGAGPHAVYVGTLHENRIDVDLLDRFIQDWPGTVHLVGPMSLSAADTERWRTHGARIQGPVPSSEVPTWLTAADVLISPHRVDDFTLSLDGIKAHEYLATDRPVVATRSSGFQELSAPGLTLTDPDDFTAAAIKAAAAGPRSRGPSADWDARAREFARVLGLVI